MCTDQHTHNYTNSDARTHARSRVDAPFEKKRCFWPITTAASEKENTAARAGKSEFPSDPFRYVGDVSNLFILWYRADVVCVPTDERSEGKRPPTPPLASRAWKVFRFSFGHKIYVPCFRRLTNEWPKKRSLYIIHRRSNIFYFLEKPNKVESAPCCSAVFFFFSCTVKNIVCKLRLANNRTSREHIMEVYYG